MEALAQQLALCGKLLNTVQHDVELEIDSQDTTQPYSEYSRLRTLYARQAPRCHCTLRVCEVLKSGKIVTAVYMARPSPLLTALVNSRVPGTQWPDLT